MFRRLFWLCAGAALGAYGATKVNQAARRLTPGRLAGSAARRALKLGSAALRLADNVRAGMATSDPAPARRGTYPAAPGSGFLPGQRPRNTRTMYHANTHNHWKEGQ